MKIRFIMPLTIALATVGCGVKETNSETKITGGEVVPENQNDHRRWSTVALTTDVSRNGSSRIEMGRSFCSGTIVGPRTILTAAHCLQKMDPESRTKIDELHFPNESDFIVSFNGAVSRGGSWIRAERVIPHPEWNVAETLTPQPSSPPHDIGVIILEEDIPNHMRIADFVPLSHTFAEGEQVALAGYGVTESRESDDTGTLRQVTVPVSAADSTAWRVSVGEFFRGACAGDSGGPAYAMINGTYKVFGATSTGAEIMGRCLGMMSNYTDARYYIDWIEDQSN